MGFCYHILLDFNTLYLTRFRNYKIATQHQTKILEGKGPQIHKINTCRKVPLQVYFLDDDIFLECPSIE
jgi:hypothetical protein